MHQCCETCSVSRETIATFNNVLKGCMWHTHAHTLCTSEWTVTDVALVSSRCAFTPCVFLCIDYCECIVWWCAPNLLQVTIEHFGSGGVLLYVPCRVSVPHTCEIAPACIRTTFPSARQTPADLHDPSLKHRECYWLTHRHIQRAQNEHLQEHLWGFYLL